MIQSSWLVTHPSVPAGESVYHDADSDLDDSEGAMSAFCWNCLADL